ncbi:Kelch repeat-containing protein [Aliikangiella coralliicola]|uniref:Galactose oxidase n=1 Tax=Aliikangiella coralliicola TaxID=2592383 RepID=A0A545UJ55_9GAMM|nr:kelch repeat-containing protein [Aliikangiella coralliicola]TQV89496.1 hypothetical protein FLL46_01030 [Aliikangiella coralliicola]
MNRRHFLYSATSGMVIFSQPSFAKLFGSNKKNLCWKSLASIPVKIQEIYPSVFKGKIYVGGGLAEVPNQEGVMGKLSLTNKVYVYNPVTNQWSIGPSLPEARHHLGLVANEKYLYGIGGFSAVTGNAWKFSNSVFRLSKDKSYWQVAPSLPVAQAESIYTTIGNTIHVIGGREVAGKKTQKSTDSSRHWKLIDDKYWEEAAPISVARNSAAGVTLNGKIYYIGGRIYAKQHQNQTLVERYDPEMDAWEKVSPIPLATAGISAAVANGKIYVFGGERWINRNTSRSKWITYSDVWQYDPQKDKWEKAGDMSSTRHGLGAVTINDQIYLIGGAFQAGISGTTSLLEVMLNN